MGPSSVLSKRFQEVYGTAYVNVEGEPRFFPCHRDKSQSGQMDTSVWMQISHGIFHAVCIRDVQITTGCTFDVVLRLFNQCSHGMPGLAQIMENMLPNKTVGARNQNAHRATSP